MNYNEFNPMMPFSQSQNQQSTNQNRDIDSSMTNRQINAGNNSSTGNNNINNMNSSGNSQGTISTPPQQGFNNEEMIGSIQKIFADNIGVYVVIEFLIGTERIVRKQGYIYFVGTSYVILYDDQINNYIMCDIFSVKFVYFYYPGDRPRQNFNLLNNNTKLSSSF